DPIVTLFTFFLRRKLCVSPLEPFHCFVVVVFAEESETGLIERFGQVRTLRETIDYIDEMSARFWPVTIEQIDSSASHRVEFVWLCSRRFVERIQPGGCGERVIVTRSADQLIENRARLLGFSGLRVSFAESRHRGALFDSCR